MTLEKLHLTNRFSLATDGWFQVVPIGEFPHPSGVVQVLDTAAMERMAADFRNRAQSSAFPGLVVDFDHESHDPSKSSQAAGWITALENRSDGLWARIRWSDIGEAAVRNGRFRLISPVFDRATAEDLGNRRVRPTRLLDAALTNDPNLKTLPPLSNRGGATPAVDPQQKMKTVLHALGLAPDASEESALQAVTALRGRAETAETSAGQLTNRATAAEAELKQLRETTADGDLARFKDRIPAGTEAFWRGNLIANRSDTLKALEGMSPRSATQTPAGGKILNRGTASVPGDRAAAAEKDAAGEFNAEVNRYRLSNRCSHDQAFDAVRRERPDLFAAATAPAAEEVAAQA